MSDKSKLRSEIRSAVKSNLDGVVGGAWKKYYAPNIPEEIYNCTLSHFGVWEDIEDVIAVVDTTISNACDEGLVFTTEALHYKYGYNSPQVFEYDDIEYMRVDGDELFIDTSEAEDQVIGATYYKKKPLMALLEKLGDIVNG